MKLLVAISSLIISTSAWAFDLSSVMISSQEAVVQSTMGLSWKVGDELNYNFKMSFFSGKMKMRVTEVTNDSLTIQQDVELGIGQNQSCVMKINPNTGETQSITCNGQNQNIPSKDDLEVVDMTDEKVTVPAGTFDSVHIKIKQKSDNKIIEQWVNVQELPITGMVKAIMPSQFGNVGLELVSFKKN